MTEVQALKQEREELRTRLILLNNENRGWFQLAQEAHRLFGDIVLTVDQNQFITKLEELIELKQKGK